MRRKIQPFLLWWKTNKAQKSLQNRVSCIQFFFFLCMCKSGIKLKMNKKILWPVLVHKISNPLSLIRANRGSCKMLVASHDLSSWTKLPGYVFAVYYIQYWMLNGHLPNGKENGEHMGLINREKLNCFFFLFLLLAWFQLLWLSY